MLTILYRKSLFCLYLPQHPYMWKALEHLSVDSYLRCDVNKASRLIQAVISERPVLSSHLLNEQSDQSPTGFQQLLQQLLMLVQLASERSLAVQD